MYPQNSHTYYVIYTCLNVLFNLAHLMMWWQESNIYLPEELCRPRVL